MTNSFWQKKCYFLGQHFWVIGILNDLSLNNSMHNGADFMQDVTDTILNVIVE